MRGRLLDGDVSITALSLEELTVERLRRVQYALAGPPEQVRTEIEAVQSVYDGGNLEWFGLVLRSGLHAIGRGSPADRAIRETHHPLGAGVEKKLVGIRARPALDAR